jgi:hypothetical protein
VRIIYCADTIIDANLVKGVLEEAGVRAFIGGESVAGPVGGLPCRTLINVMVAIADIERALPIARTIDEALSAPRRECVVAAAVAAPAVRSIDDALPPDIAIA